MRHNKLALYLHLVWTTWDREPLLIDAVTRRVNRVIEDEVKKLGCDILALNGLADHVHLLVTIPTTITVANLAKQVKGVSSHFCCNDSSIFPLAGLHPCDFMPDKYSVNPIQCG